MKIIFVNTKIFDSVTGQKLMYYYGASNIINNKTSLLDVIYCCCQYDLLNNGNYGFTSSFYIRKQPHDWLMEGVKEGYIN